MWKLDVVGNANQRASFADMEIKFTIKNLDRDHSSFLVEKFAPAFGLEFIQSAPSLLHKNQIKFTLEGTPRNAQAFERHLKSEVAVLHGTYIEQ